MRSEPRVPRAPCGDRPRAPARAQWGATGEMGLQLSRSRCRQTARRDRAVPAPVHPGAGPHAQVRGRLGTRQRADRHAAGSHRDDPDPGVHPVQDLVGTGHAGRALDRHRDRAVVPGHRVRGQAGRAAQRQRRGGGRGRRARTSLAWRPARSTRSTTARSTPRPRTCRRCGSGLHRHRRPGQRAEPERPAHHLALRPGGPADAAAAARPVTGGRRRLLAGLRQVAAGDLRVECDWDTAGAYGAGWRAPVNRVAIAGQASSTFVNDEIGPHLAERPVGSAVAVTGSRTRSRRPARIRPPALASPAAR